MGLFRTQPVQSCYRSKLTEFAARPCELSCQYSRARCRLNRRRFTAASLASCQRRAKVPAYTDLKVHDISATSNPATNPECEPLDQNQPATTPSGIPNPKFFAGNCWFISSGLDYLLSTEVCTIASSSSTSALSHQPFFTSSRMRAKARSGVSALR
jgi:hypothetical protein